jgi:hypothetical protein
MEVPSASAICFIPAFFSPLFTAFIVSGYQSFQDRAPCGTQIYFDSESEGCVVLLPVTYTFFYRFTALPTSEELDDPLSLGFLRPHQDLSP